MKEDILDVIDPCYPLFFAELESAEALATAQWKFQTLNLADYKVMRKLLPITLVCHPTGVWFRFPTGYLMMFAKMDFPALATYEDIEPDNLCPMKAPEQLETFLRTMKRSGVETPLEEQD